MTFSLWWASPLLKSRNSFISKKKKVINWTWLKTDYKRFSVPSITIPTPFVTVTCSFHRLLMDSWLRFVTVPVQISGVNAKLSFYYFLVLNHAFFFCELVHMYRFRVIRATLMFGRVSSPYNLINARWAETKMIVGVSSRNRCHLSDYHCLCQVQIEAVKMMKTSNSDHCTWKFFVVSTAKREFKKWRQQRQRQRYRSKIWLAEWRNIIARHALWCNFLTSSAKRRREIFIFEVLTTLRANSSKSLIICLYMKTIRARQAKAHFAYFVPRDQHGIIAKHFN